MTLISDSLFEELSDSGQEMLNRAMTKIDELPEQYYLWRAEAFWDDEKEEWVLAFSYRFDEYVMRRENIGTFVYGIEKLVDVIEAMDPDDLDDLDDLALDIQCLDYCFNDYTEEQYYNYPLDDDSSA